MRVESLRLTQGESAQQRPLSVEWLGGCRSFLRERVGPLLRPIQVKFRGAESGGTLGVVTSAVATPKADPIFDALAQAALDRGFGPEEFVVGTYSPEGYVIRLERFGLYAEGMINPQLVEDGAGDPALYFIDKLWAKMHDFGTAA